MIYYKNVRLKKVTNGYLIECDKYIASKDAYDGMRYVSQKEEVFEDGESALARLNELHSKEMKMDKMMMAKMEKKVSEEKNESEY